MGIRHELHDLLVCSPRTSVEVERYAIGARVLPIHPGGRVGDLIAQGGDAVVHGALRLLAKWGWAFAHSGREWRRGAGEWNQHKRICFVRCRGEVGGQIPSQSSSRCEHSR